MAIKVVAMVEKVVSMAKRWLPWTQKSTQMPNYQRRPQELLSPVVTHAGSPWEVSGVLCEASGDERSVVAHEIAAIACYCLKVPGPTPDWSYLGVAPLAGYECYCWKGADGFA
jgi:hypothetical protein